MSVIRNTHIHLSLLFSPFSISRNLKKILSKKDFFIRKQCSIVIFSCCIVYVDLYITTLIDRKATKERGCPVVFSIGPCTPPPSFYICSNNVWASEYMSSCASATALYVTNPFRVFIPLSKASFSKQACLYPLSAI